MQQPEQKQTWTTPEGITQISGTSQAGGKNCINIKGKIYTTFMESYAPNDAPS